MKERKETHQKNVISILGKKTSLSHSELGSRISAQLQLNNNLAHQLIGGNTSHALKQLEWTFKTLS